MFNSIEYVDALEEREEEEEEKFERNFLYSQNNDRDEMDAQSAIDTASPRTASRASPSR